MLAEKVLDQLYKNIEAIAISTLSIVLHDNKLEESLWLHYVLAQR